MGLIVVCGIATKNAMFGQKIKLGYDSHVMYEFILS
jgi:hypothetical protein